MQLNRIRRALALLLAAVITAGCGSTGTIERSTSSSTSTSSTTTSTTTTTTVPVAQFVCPDRSAVDALLATARASDDLVAAGQADVRTSKDVTCFGHWAVGNVGRPEMDASAIFAGRWADGSWDMRLGFGTDSCAYLSEHPGEDGVGDAQTYLGCGAPDDGADSTGGGTSDTCDQAATEDTFTMCILRHAVDGTEPAPKYASDVAKMRAALADEPDRSAPKVWLCEPDNEYRTICVVSVHDFGGGEVADTQHLRIVLVNFRAEDRFASHPGPGLMLFEDVTQCGGSPWESFCSDERIPHTGD